MNFLQRSFTAVLIGSCLLSTGIAFAADKTAKSDPVDDLLNNVVTHQLPNGMKILLLEDHSAPVITAQIWVKTGSRNEVPGITGISHLFEHMMFRGSAKYGPEEHASLISRFGGECNAYTTDDETVYFETIASDQLELVVHLEAERFANLKLDSAVLIEERKVVSEERRMRTDNNLFGAAFEQLGINFYQSSTYAWPVIGWMHDIMGYTVKDIQDYYRLHYSPNNIVAVVVGDFKTQDAKNLFDKYWSKIPSQPTPPPPNMIEVEQRGERRVILKRQAEMPMLFAAYHIPPKTDADQPALEVLSRVLSSGNSSRLYQRLVYKDRVARFAGGDTDDRIGPGMFAFYLGMIQGKSVEEGEKAMWEEVERLRNEPISESELIKAKNQIESSTIGRIGTTSERASVLGSYETGFGSFKTFKDRTNAMLKVTAADVQRVAKKYLNPDQRTVLTVVPTQETENEAATGTEGEQK